MSDEDAAGAGDEPGAVTDEPGALAGEPDGQPAGIPEDVPLRRAPGLAGVTRYRSVLLVGAAVGVIFAVALAFVLLASGGNPDSVPGTDPIASLAAIPSGFLVGTTGGLAASGDGMSWSVAHLPSELVAVASNTSTAYVLTGG
ncbi:MAG TPA: hypothetical protein VKY26_11085, partial [Actinomycetota bacterium]|nr:hypothetical protein [Actinomycetota bacterium]